MIIPSHGDPSSSLNIENNLPSFSYVQTFGPSLPTGNWSSIIGIVTALIGNVLISIALNTQRYAHIRLEREAQGEAPGTDEHRHAPGQANEDHQLRRQSKLADEISKRNKSSKPVLEQDGEIYTHTYHEAAHENETSPLLKKTAGEAKQPDSASRTDAEVDEKETGPHERKNYLRSKLWWLGICLMVLGEAGNFLAYGFAPASIVSPLGVVALISNCLIAPLFLHEKFRKRDLLGVIISVGGAVAVVLSAKGSNPKLGPNNIWHLIKQWEFLTYFGITIVLIITFMFLSNKYGEKTIVIDIGLVGLFGGYTALSTKGVASLLSYRFFQIFTFPIAYLLVAVLVGTAIMQIKYVNRALQRFDSTQVIPTQFCAFTVFVVAGSAILYRDFESMTASHLAQFFGGVALTFLGVWVITSGRKENDSHHDENEDEEQEIDMVDDETPVSPRTLTTATPSPPSTPKARTYQEEIAPDTPASFATATSEQALAPSPLSRSQKPSLSTTTSSPQLPSQRTDLTKSMSRPAHLAPPSKTDTRPKSPGRGISDYTPGATSSSTAATLAAPQTPTPRQLLSRSALASSAMPNLVPYTSPLSSGLSVVVADSRRRDERASLGRRRSIRTSAPKQPGDALSKSAPKTPAGGLLASASADTSDLQGLIGASVRERPRVGERGNTAEDAGTGVGSSRTVDSGAETPPVVLEHREAEEGDEQAQSSSKSSRSGRDLL